MTTLSLAAKLARRELRGGIAGFRILIACLALGVGAIAAISTLSHAITEGLQRDGRAILGGDLSMRLQFQKAPEGALEAMKQYGEATWSIETFTSVAHTGDRADPDALPVMVDLKAVDAAYPLYGSLDIAGGGDGQALMQPQDGVFGALADSALMSRMQIEVGDVLQLGETEIVIRGVIEKEPDKAGSGKIQLGPRLMINQATLAATQLDRPEETTSLIYRYFRVKTDPSTDLDQVANAVRAVDPNVTGWRQRTWRNAAPEVERFIDRLTVFLSLVGLTALLVGGVGVSNATRAFMESRLKTIAMLKCVGAEGKLITQTYILQVLALSTVGIAIGLFIGGVVPLLAAGPLSAVLPFDVAVSIDFAGLALAALFGWLVALSFSLWPIGQAQAIPAAAIFRALLVAPDKEPPRNFVLAVFGLGVGLAALCVLTAERQELAFWFVIGSLMAMATFRFAAHWLMILARKLPRPKTPALRMAVTNLFRPGAPTVPVVLSLGLGLTVLVCIALIEANLSRQLSDNLTEETPSFFFLDVQPEQVEQFRAELDQIDGVHNLQTVPLLRGRLVKVNGRPAAEMRVTDEHRWVTRGDRGLTYRATNQNPESTVAGEWWPEDYNDPDNPLVSVDIDVVEAFGIGPGDKLSFLILGREFEAEIAHVRNTDWGSAQINFAIVFSPGMLEAAPHSMLATVQADSTAAEDQIARMIPQQFPTVTAIRVKEALELINQVLEKIALAVRALAAVAIVSGTIVLAGAIAAGHRRRLYDAVVMKVLGARRSDALKAYALEYGLMGLITAGLSVLTGGLAAYGVIVGIMDMRWVWVVEPVVWTVIIATTITLLLGFIGTWAALGQKPAPILRTD